TPPIAHLFNSLPFFKLNFLRTYDPDTLLAVSLLAASGLKFVIYELRQSSWGQTWRQARGLLLTIALLGLSMAASPRLTDFSAGVTGVGINPLLQDQRQNELRGGIADAGLVKVFSKNHVVRGWFDPRAFPPVSGVWVGLHGRSDSFQPAQLSYSAQRVSFQGTVSLPPGESRPLAVLPHSREDRTVFAGSQISYEPIPFSTVWKTVLILALLLLFPLGIENRLLSRAVPLLLLAYCAWAMSAHSPHIVSAKDMPPRLGSMQWLKSDRDLFRTYSAEPNYFFQPEFPGIYGIQDLRSGADNMDVLAAVHFLHLVGPLAASASREHQKLAYQVLGLANVKYLFFRPYPRPVSPTLKKVYSGPEAVLYQNPYFQARALFFPASSARVLPTPDLKKWEAANQFLQALSQSILRGEIDPGRHLLLHQPVPPASPPASAPALAKPVPLLTYRAHEVVARVHSDQAGFLFLSDNHFPGWKAFLDGKPAPILPSWIAFRAVAVPAGTHDIRFIYEPRLLKRGIPFGALLGFLLIGLRLREKKGGAPGHPQSAPELSLLEILIYVPLGLSAWYWISWTAFVYQGNLWARGAAVLAGGILLREGWRLWRNRN
ncbi:MAG: hypothetical protein HY402_03235, partial [Elusimicrobia bacterium]|nr:hypothetical protein [Elusimicrobiota bacterium]